jgi:chemotaxis protein CheX
MRDVEIAKHFIKATTNILATMAGITATPGKPYVKKDQVASGDISAIIGVTGPRNGTISVSFSSASATALVVGMLGEDVGDMNQDMQDAVGEVTNMISGQARASIAGEGLTLQGSTPSVIMGKNHTIHHMTKAVVMAIPFTTPDGDFTVEFCLA